MLIIAPSLLSADFSKLGDEVKRVSHAGADWIHFDIMDGSFVKNITVGPDVIAHLRNKSKLTFDTHLMIENPQRYIEQFAKAGSDVITFHIEAAIAPKSRLWQGKGWAPKNSKLKTQNVKLARDIIEQIKSFGKKVGIAVNPDTPIDFVYPFIEDVYLILVMTVWPGFGGQNFMERQLKKIQALRKKFGEKINIEVDGGLNNITSKKARSYGANIIVAGNYVFKNANLKDAIAGLREI